MITILFLAFSYASAGEFVYGVNCGGARYIDSMKNVYVEDMGFEGGDANEDDILSFIKYTNDSILYQSQRSSRTLFTYKVPIQVPGKYVMSMKFAETDKSVGDRKFQIGMGEMILDRSFDISENIGRFAALDYYVEFIYQDDVIYLDGDTESIIMDRSVSNETILIHFIRLQNAMGYPKINAIALYRGEVPEEILNAQNDAIEDYQRLKAAKEAFMNYTRPDIFEDKNTSNYLEEPLTAIYVLFRYPLTVLFCSLIMFAMLVKLVPKKGQLRNIERKRFSFE